MGGTSPNFVDWRGLSAIKIWEVAAQMHGVDPRALGDVMVADPNDPIGINGIPLDTTWEERMLISAAKTQDVLTVPLNVTAPDVYTEISRISLLPWLRIQGYQDLANQLDTNTSLQVVQPPVAPPLVGAPLPVPITTTQNPLQPTLTALSSNNGMANLGPTFTMKKAAMVDQHKHEWPSIERDMKDAARNGLSKALAGSREWNESIAMDWARANNKLVKATEGTSALDTAMRSLSSLSSTVHALDG
jgi:hypothetical protein